MWGVECGASGVKRTRARFTPYPKPQDPYPRPLSPRAVYIGTGMNRRTFALLLPGAAALPALAAAAPMAGARAAVDPAAAPPDPLTPAQMAQYEKNAPERARATAHLRAYPLTNAIQPDFVFVAAPAARQQEKQGGKP